MELSRAVQLFIGFGVAPLLKVREPEVRVAERVVGRLVDELLEEGFRLRELATLKAVHRLRPRREEDFHRNCLLSTADDCHDNRGAEQQSTRPRAEPGHSRSPMWIAFAPGRPAHEYRAGWCERAAWPFDAGEAARQAACCISLSGLLLPPELPPL